MPHPTPSAPEASPSPTSHAADAGALSAAPAKLPLHLGQEDVRRPSIQFLANQGRPKRSDSPKVRPQRRLSSPPPPPVFQQRVSFDTFDKPADFIEENSFTLSRKHKDYEYTKRSRTFLCGLDSNDYSEYALEWLIDELVDDGDEIVCLRVVEKDDKVAADSSVERGRYREEAERLMDRIQMKNTENKAINLILEFSVGKVQKVIEEMINLYEPAILIVGTRGRSLGGFQGLLPGSVSKYCLQHSPVPVIVVRPSTKRAKTKRKRLQDPTRTGYRDLLDKSGPAGSHILDTHNRHSIMLGDIAKEASEEEAAAVAKAVGFVPPPDPSPLAQVENAGVQEAPMTPEYTRDEFLSPDNSPEMARVMKSPELGDLDSPADSGSDMSDEEEGGVQMIPPLDSVMQQQPPTQESEEKTEPEKAEPEKAGPDKTEPEKAEPESERAEPEKAEPEQTEVEAEALPDEVSKVNLNLTLPP
ncbi:uncharacterized protein K452DRAFT_275486 [Aplosporella prunicola CBS 121167]|uniref:UspA domain-containing protein n=1 Tax=Aplosporella prunicola CBS 121167 TaxID=1176127 RepID=A0A6A6B7R2_9PEZI|nr:uncharacterized protein K452DRAFT_275486 [Aplosporella prunicola CBS 121167]KAF2139305.1 hypothetical protein K452DRAFT_275486 [Aplosporella prunicola CBS 121167]